MFTSYHYTRIIWYVTSISQMQMDRGGSTMLFIFLNIFIFIAVPILITLVCLSMDNSKTDNRNNSAGYRTKRSLYSQENWNIANRTFGYCSVGITLVDILSIILIYKVLIPRDIINGKEETLFINLIVFILGVTAAIIITEVQLRKINPSKKS